MKQAQRPGYAAAAAKAEDGGIAPGAAEACVLFLVDDQKYALRLDEIERIVRAVEVKPLPESPAHVRGIVNVQGRVLPVIDLRARFGQKPQAIRLEDHFLIACMPGLSVVLPVDAALGSTTLPGGSKPTAEEARRHYLRKVVRQDTDVVYALDLKQVVFGDGSLADPAFASVRAAIEAT